MNICARKMSHFHFFRCRQEDFTKLGFSIVRSHARSLDAGIYISPPIERFDSIVRRNNENRDSWSLKGNEKEEACAYERKTILRVRINLISLSRRIAFLSSDVQESTSSFVFNVA